MTPHPEAPGQLRATSLHGPACTVFPIWITGCCLLWGDTTWWNEAELRRLCPGESGPSLRPLSLISLISFNCINLLMQMFSVDETSTCLCMRVTLVWLTAAEHVWSFEMWLCGGVRENLPGRNRFHSIFCVNVTVLSAGLLILLLVQKPAPESKAQCPNNKFTFFTAEVCLDLILYFNHSVEAVFTSVLGDRPKQLYTEGSVNRFTALHLYLKTTITKHCHVYRTKVELDKEACWNFLSFHAGFCCPATMDVSHLKRLFLKLKKLIINLFLSFCGFYHDVNMWVA